MDGSAGGGPECGRGAAGAVLIAGAIVPAVLLGSALVARRWHPIAHESIGEQGSSMFVWALGILSIAGLGIAVVKERDAEPTSVADVRPRTMNQIPPDLTDTTSASLAAEPSPPGPEVPAWEQGETTSSHSARHGHDTGASATRDICPGGARPSRGPSSSNDEDR